MITYAIAHRGASDHAPENTLAAFRLAAELGANMWEIDVHLSKDGVCIVCHDERVERTTDGTGAIEDLTAAEIQSFRIAGGERIPTLDEVIDLAESLGCGLYVEIKAEAAAALSVRRLRARGFRNAVVGSFQAGWVRALREADCPYPLSVLVPVGADPFAMAEASGADIIHLCWERAGERPQDLVTPALLDRARKLGLQVVLWHEERPSVLADILKLPLLGICGNQPELLVPALLPTAPRPAVGVP